MKQKESVFQAIVRVLGFTPDSKVELSKDQRTEVVGILVTGFMAGTIEHSTGFQSEEDATAYASGLLSNWLRKDPRLNGGGKYTPATKRGPSDAQLSEMRKLLSAVESEEDKATIQAAIDARVAELQKSKVPTIDPSKLPESLRGFVRAA